MPQSEETRAELSQITWVARQVQSLSIRIDYNVTPDLFEYSDYLAAGKQACHGDCAGHLVRYSQVYTSRLLHGLGDRAKYFIVGAWLGRHRTDTRDHCPKAFVDREADSQLSDPLGHQHCPQI